MANPSSILAEHDGTSGSKGKRQNSDWQVVLQVQSG